MPARRRLHPAERKATAMMTLELILQGLVMGVFYAMMGVGLTLIFGILKVVYFAHGESFMVGAYAYAFIAGAFGLPLPVALASALIIGAMLAVIVERLLIRPLYEKFGDWQQMRDEYAIIVTFGLSLLLINAANQFIGPYPMHGPGLIDVPRFQFGDIIIGGHRLVAGILGLMILAAALWFIQHSFWGKQIRAVAQNRFGASIAGIDTRRVSALVFMVAGGLAALSGALLVPLFHAKPDVGLVPALKSFVIVVLGGMGSPIGAIIGGLMLGVIESFGAFYISYAYRDTFAFMILIAVLLLRPQGLFGERAREV
jgi:branched-chain amino acid transport system permease protein